MSPIEINTGETSTTTPPPEEAQQATRLSLVVIFLTVFIDLLGFGMVLPLLPVYTERLTSEMSSVQQGLVIGGLMSCFSLMQFLFAPAWGRLSDRVGRRPIILVGLLGSCVCYAGLGVATMYQSLIGLYLSRIGAGICGATISTSQAYIADVTTLANRARGMALIGAAFGLGFTFGPLLGAAALLFSAEVHLSPWPGFAAAAISGGALLLAFLRLPESLRTGSVSAARGLFDATALKHALAIRSVAALLATLFVCIFAFANFESTLARLLKDEHTGFGFTFKGVLLVFAFIGITLTFAQGVVVRRLTRKIREATMATWGSVLSVLGFVLVAMASESGNLAFLLAALAVEVMGFAMVTPSINSLVSRWSDPKQQGGILGLTQSVGALARILGPMCGNSLFQIGPGVPFWAATGLMIVGTALVVFAARSGHDFVVESA